MGIFIQWNGMVEWNANSGMDTPTKLVAALSAFLQSIKVLSIIAKY